MSTITFQEIKNKKTLTGLCKVCKKKRTRTIDEKQTINPFNKNQDGTIKNYFEVNKSVEENLEKRVKRFQEEEFICRKCKPYLGY